MSLGTTALVALAWLASAAFIGAPQSPRPVERLSVFEGTWTREGPTPGDTLRETCAWLAGGRRHLVCDTEARRPTGPARMLRIHSYQNGSYVVYVAMGDGPAWTYTGGPESDGRWVLNLQSNRSDNPQRLRIVITPAADRIRFVEESSTNGGPWRTTEDYTNVRVR